MAKRGWSRGRRCAELAAVGMMMLVGTACSADFDRGQSLETTLTSVDGVDDAEIRPATTDRLSRLGITLDLDLDATQTLGTVRRIDNAARKAGFTDYVLELSRTLTGDDVVVVGDDFPDDLVAEQVLGDWIRVVDAMLGEVTYEYDSGSTSIAIVSGGGIAHDVAEASRIGSGEPRTTWRFVAESSAFVVSGVVDPRDVTLFNRVQRTVASSVLPVPATRWELHRRSGQVLLDLEVALAGGSTPQQITIERWGADLRHLAAAAVEATTFPRLPRWIQISDAGPEARDTFAAWSSETRPVQGRDRYSRGWDAWWQRLAR